MFLTKSRLEREKETIRMMIALHCKDHHENSVCDNCNELFEYALKKLNKCPFGWDKPVCNKCEIHCYSKEKREEIRQVMRYSGPKMIFKHPVAAVMHIIDKRYKPKNIDDIIKMKKNDKSLKSNE